MIRVRPSTLLHLSDDPATNCHIILFSGFEKVSDFPDVTDKAEVTDWPTVLEVEYSNPAQPWIAAHPNGPVEPSPVHVEVSKQMLKESDTALVYSDQCETSLLCSTPSVNTTSSALLIDFHLPHKLSFPHKWMYLGVRRPRLSALFTLAPGPHQYVPANDNH